MLNVVACVRTTLILHLYYRWFSVLVRRHGHHHRHSHRAIEKNIGHDKRQHLRALSTRCIWHRGSQLSYCCYCSVGSGTRAVRCRRKLIPWSSVDDRNMTSTDDGRRTTAQRQHAVGGQCQGTSGGRTDGLHQESVRMWAADGGQQRWHEHDNDYVRSKQAGRV